MPQTISGGPLNTVTLAATDLATINLGGGLTGSTVSVMNYGPGKVMLSDNSKIVPTMASTNCLLLGPGVGYNSGLINGACTLLLIADTASTVVSIGVSR